jgi:hypothetical protein
MCIRLERLGDRRTGSQAPGRLGVAELLPVRPGELKSKQVLDVHAMP